MTSPLKTYQFTWGVDGTMYDPRWPTLRVRARNVRSAKVKARAKLAALLRHEGRPHWEWRSETREWTRVARREVKGRLMYEPVVVKRLKRFKPRKGSVFSSKPSPEALEAFASFISAPIQQVIDKAPINAALFSTSLPDTAPGFSIPISFASYSRTKPVGDPIGP